MFYIGLKIKKLMREKNIDAPTLAKKMNKTKQAVYYLLEKKDVSTSVLRDLANIFAVPVTFFLTEENEETVGSQEEIDRMKEEIKNLKKELDRLRGLKLPTKDERALAVSMKFFEAAKEMFAYYNQLKQ